MIVFEKMGLKNFLSFGNQETWIDFTKGKISLIVGRNGSGKSVITDAFTFALYGKPFRKINKPQLVNTINQNNLVVTLFFSVGESKYKVIRGIKPNIFEIYKDGELINQSSSVADYQTMLETDILKMNYTMFTQLIMLGKATYIPFMRLPVGKRRELIEDLLYLSVFSEMKEITKDKLSELKELLSKYQTKKLLLEERINGKHEQIKLVKEKSQKQRDNIQEEINQLQAAIDNIKTKKSELADVAKKLYDSIDGNIDSLSEEYKTLKQDRIKQTTILDELQANLEFYTNNDTCPKCNQVLQDKDKIVMDLKDDIDAKRAVLDRIDSTLERVSEQIENIRQTHRKINKVQDKITDLVNKENTLMAQMTSLVKRLSDDSDDISGILSEIDTLKQQNEKLIKAVSTLDKRIKQYNVIMDLLKDSGIKSLILKKYIPIFNKLINGYLEKMGIRVMFIFDEVLNETIYARHKDKFQYNSFSEGEKLRIDLAIMMAWRELAKVKNAKNANLIFMDEVFDSSMDQSGVDAFFDVLSELEDNTNVFIISHTPEKLDNRADIVYNVQKIGNFSSVTQQTT